MSGGNKLINFWLDVRNNKETESPAMCCWAVGLTESQLVSQLSSSGDFHFAEKEGKEDAFSKFPLVYGGWQSFSYNSERLSLPSNHYENRLPGIVPAMDIDDSEAIIIRHGIVKRINFGNIKKRKPKGGSVEEVGDLVIEVHESSLEEKKWASRMLRKVGSPFDEQIVEVSLLFFALPWLSQMAHAQLPAPKLILCLA